MLFRFGVNEFSEFQVVVKDGSNEYVFKCNDWLDGKNNEKLLELYEEPDEKTVATMNSNF